ncbi:Methyltransferase [Schizosaccharomyces pombe]|uniref:Uncharacterized methyltransferase C3B9.04, mitochondrial n=1 Tax=Schizosaccharomyces pombe (strain 972 / ATCC 24843) TaxID=284812 RepID=YGU4_SCHPO|nr:putative methyltransferase [Schizosaccharomyces pombe]O43033.1 RecName: Full=Uncharacterized methyltransferase C3B9.04, mitochondrial [Schizosaccharomyces pombe 972h-]CAA17784.1 mitochondrial methyltransferase (predicted) [Schizosaccharomyces pombe]|eukprot:NP_596661.1 putative methyltransferase [Schizosaccharomyces pombe]
MGILKKTIFIGGIYGLGVYIGAVAWRLRKDVLNYESRQKSDLLIPNSNSISIYNQIADKYSRKITREEIFSGIYFLRYFLLRNAKGDVLEVGSGPGTNFPFYKWKKINTLTLVEPAEKMREIADARAKKKVPPNVLYRQFADLRQLPPNQSYDTIIQTFCICSQEKAVEQLNNYRSLLRSDGRILLIEHGKGKYKFLNRILNAYAESHYESWGCVWNRDIEQLLEDSELTIDSCKRFNFGTTYVIEAH